MLVVTEPIGHHYGWESNAYRVAYDIATLAILVASYCIVRSREPRGWTAPLMYGMFLFVLGFESFPMGFSVDTWINLINGTLVAIFGVALATRMRGDRVLETLAALWLALSGFFFVCALMPASLIVARLADFLTYLFGIAAFTWIGVELRSGNRREHGWI